MSEDDAARVDVAGDGEESGTDAANGGGPAGPGHGVGGRTRLERWFMHHLPRGRGGKLGIVVLVAAVTLAVLGVGATVANLDCGDAPAMVRLEVVGASDAAASALIGDPASGDEPCTKSDVRDALLGDILFIVGYVALLGVGAVAFGVAGYRVGRFRILATPIAFGAVAAGVLDVGENISLWFGVDREPAELAIRSDWPFLIAATFAWAKWFVVVIVAAYVVTGFIGYLFMPKWILDLRSRVADGDRPTAELAELPAIGEVPASTPSAPSHVEHAGHPDDGELFPEVDVGIALSGGGVRSATFALGGMQALDASGNRRWDDATRITSVSGGGYMSGAWSLTRGYSDYATPPGQADPWADPGVQRRRQGHVSAEETYLRQHLGYLLEAENDRPGGIPTLLVGLAANVFALLLIVYLLARPFGWLIVEFVDPDVANAYERADYQLSITTAQWLPAVAWLVVGLVVLLAWVLYSRIQRWLEGGIGNRTSRALHLLLKWGARVGLVLGLALLLVLVVAPVLMVVVPGELVAALGGEPGPVVAAISGIAGIGVVASVRTLIADQASRWATKLGGVLLAVAVIVLGGWWATDAAVDGIADTRVTWVAWLVFAAVGLYAVSPEWWAMAPFYRGRLRRAYALRNEGGAVTSYPSVDEPRLEDLAGQPGPLAEYCCALNVRDSRVTTLSGIPALSFTMSSDAIAVHHVDPITGAASAWTCTPAQMSALMKAEAPKVSTMLAVAASGAAVASAMGRLGQGSTNALLAFANVRLGVWLPHPKWAGRAGPGKTSYPRVRMSYLLKEVFGLFDWDDLHVYITDGAHWEGTAIVELFRNDDIDEAIAFDAGGAGGDSLVSPAEVVTLSSLELFDDVDIDVEPLRAKPDGTRGGGLADRVATVGLVRGVGPGGEPTVGVLWYSRNVLAEDSSARLKSYGERFETFPSVSTINQFFDDEKFQCYRVLGYEAGTAIVEARNVLAAAMSGSDDLEDFRASNPEHWAIAVMQELLQSETEFRRVRDTLNGEPRCRVATGPAAAPAT